MLTKSKVDIIIFAFVTKINIDIDTYYINIRYAEERVIACDYSIVTDWNTVKNYGITAIGVGLGVVAIGEIAYAVVSSGGTAAPVLVPLTVEVTKQVIDKLAA